MPSAVLYSLTRVGVLPYQVKKEKEKKTKNMRSMWLGFGSCLAQISLVTVVFSFLAGPAVGVGALRAGPREV